MQRLICLIMIVLLATGCQTIMGSGTKGISPTADISAGKESGPHLIAVEVHENLKSTLKVLNFYNVAEAGKRFILVSGTIKKQMGGYSIDRKKITVQFFDEKGDLLSEGEDKISILYLRRPQGSQGRFSIKVPYTSGIKKCIVAFKNK